MNVKVKDHDNLVRNSSGAVISVDEEELMKYRKRKADLIRERDRDNEIQSLKNELKDMKALLSEVYEKLVNGSDNK